MSDRESQALERRGAAGDVEAEAAALRARLRAGLLGQAQLALAAYCGHPAARLLEPLSPPTHFSTWAYGLGQHELGAWPALRLLYAHRPWPSQGDPRPDAEDSALRAWSEREFSPSGADQALARAIREPRPVNLASAASRLAEALARPERPAYRPSWRARLWHAIGYAQPSEDEGVRRQRAREADATSAAELAEAEAQLRSALEGRLIAHALAPPAPTAS